MFSCSLGPYDARKFYSIRGNLNWEKKDDVLPMLGLQGQAVGLWDSTLDERLIKAKNTCIKARKWEVIAKEVGYGVTAKDCRDRWIAVFRYKKETATRHCYRVGDSVSDRECVSDDDKDEDYIPPGETRRRLIKTKLVAVRKTIPKRGKGVEKKRKYKLEGRVKRFVKMIWTEEADSALRDAMKIFPPKHWKEKACYVSDKLGIRVTDDQCNQRWNRVLDPDIKKDLWSPEEEETLEDLVKRYKKENPRKNISWTKISAELQDKDSEGLKRIDTAIRYHYLHNMKRQR